MGTLKHPYSLTKNIPYSQAFRIKHNYSTFQEYVNILRALTKKFVDKGYNEETIKIHIERADHLERLSLLNKPQFPEKLCIPLSAIYNPALPNLKEIIDKQ